MAKTAAGLTARKVESIKTPGMFADGNGLYLQVTYHPWGRHRAGAEGLGTNLDDQTGDRVPPPGLDRGDS